MNQPTRVPYMSDTETLRLATRGSDLALRQAAMVRDRLRTRRLEVELVQVETTGDQLQEELIHQLGMTGAFVRAVDQQVIEGDCDLAVHSLKDVPTEFPPDLVVAAVPERGAASDLLVSPGGETLESLPQKAVIGTASLRRRAELLAARPDLDVEPLRGNVDSRVETLLAPGLQAEHERRMAAEETDEAGEDDEDGEETDQYDLTVEEWFDSLAEIERRALGRETDVEYDAIVLAEAGLERAGLLPHIQYERFSRSEFVPAPGQGALAITAREQSLVETLRDRIDHPPSRVEATVERTVLETLGGGCVAPLGIHARLRGEYVNVIARAHSRDGQRRVEDSTDVPVDSHPEAARRFGERMAEAGAAELVADARRTDEERREATR
jgi:hydroxymethylbilane synthase